MGISSQVQRFRHSDHLIVLSEGVIVEQVFLGTGKKYVVRLADGTEVVVLRPISDPPFEQAAPTVRVSWAPDKATAFRD